METILVASNDEEWTSYLTTVASIEGYITKIATNGQEAYELAACLLPDLIIWDVNLPVVDGISACSLLRSEQTVPPSTPVYLAGTVKPDSKPLESAGVTGFILKNIGAAELRDLLTESLRSYPNH